jgi:hypothetical protein
MPVGYIALIFGIFGLVAAYTIQNDIKRGVTWDQRTFALDQNPIMFSVAILGKASIVALAIAEILHAFGLVGDPIAALRAILPFFITDRRQAQPGLSETKSACSLAAHPGFRV